MAFEGRAEEIFEGVAMLLAAGVLTWMIFWMARQGSTLQANLERDVRQAALIDGKGFNTPNCFWDPLIRIAVLGQLGCHGEALKAAGELLDLVPDFGTRGRSLIKRMLFRDAHVEMLVEGLRKAALELAD